jgi:glucose-6-phosphate isomerase
MSKRCKALLKKTGEELTEKAQDAAHLAKAQRAAGDKQHENAHKLEKLSLSLENDVEEIKEELKQEEALEKQPHRGTSRVH